MSSAERTPWAVRCPKHGQVFLTSDEHLDQACSDTGPWRCTRLVYGPGDVARPCREPSVFDDANAEAFADKPDDWPRPDKPEPAHVGPLTPGAAFGYVKAEPASLPSPIPRAFECAFGHVTASNSSADKLACATCLANAFPATPKGM